MTLKNVVWWSLFAVKWCVFITLGALALIAVSFLIHGVVIKAATASQDQWLDFRDGALGVALVFLVSALLTAMICVPWWAYGRLKDWSER